MKMSKYRFGALWLQVVTSGARLQVIYFISYQSDISLEVSRVALAVAAVTV